MFALLGFILGFWLLVSPCRRLHGLMRHDESRVPLLESSCHKQINPWLPLWFTLAMLASLLWMWFYAASSQYTKVQHADCVSWLWPDATIYQWILIVSGFITNLGWLIWLCFLDCKTTSLWSAISAVPLSVLIHTGYALCGEGPARPQIIGWAAVTLSLISNIFRIKSMGRRRELSWFSFSVVIAGTLPEGLWMLNVIFLERDTVFAMDGKTIAFWDIFLKKTATGRRVGQ